MHEINPVITDVQKKIIIGSILGGASIVSPEDCVNSYLSFRCKDSEWFNFKAIELKSLASKKSTITDATNRWHSKCYPIFNEHKSSFFYKGKRRLTLDNLERLWDLSLGVWFVDSGYYKKEQVVFNTNIWGKKGTEVIKKYFNLLDYDVEIFLEKKKFRIRFDPKSSLNFLQLIVPTLPLFILNQNLPPNK